MLTVATTGEVSMPINNKNAYLDSEQKINIETMKLSQAHSFSNATNGDTIGWLLSD